MSKSVHIPPFDTTAPEGAGLWLGPEVELTVVVEFGARVGAACPLLIDLLPLQRGDVFSLLPHCLSLGNQDD